MRVLVVAVVALLALGNGAVPAAGKTAEKAPHPCKVLLPDDLEPIFEQPWRRGTDELGGGCALRRPSDVDVPDIVVSLIVEEKASKRRAKRAFERGLFATEDLVPQVETIRGMGDQAYFTTIIGADVLVFRIGKTIAELRVKRVDGRPATYRDQTIAAGEIVEARLTPVRKGK